jgi:hypothetical protein
MSDKFHALKTGDWLDFWGLNAPRCPHCGTEYDIAANDAWRLYEEGEHEVECDGPNCGREFTVTVRVSYSFSTDEQPDEEEEESEEAGNADR